MSKVVFLPSANCKIFFYHAGEKEAFEKDYETSAEEHEFGCCCGNGVFINTECKNKNFSLVSTIAHECSHAVDWVLHERLDMEVLPNGITEIKAYMLDYLVGKCAKHCGL